MTPEIPSYIDLMHPTLRALEKLGGTASYGDIDRTVIEIAGISDEQLQVQFPESAAQGGSKVVHRIAWARSYLKKLEAVEILEWGIWRLTDQGRRYLALTDPDGELRHHEHELRVGRRPELFLKQVSERVKSDAEYTTTVRELLAEWDIKRRGSAVVARILRDLSEAGLTTAPPFDQISLDDRLRIVALATAPPSRQPDVTAEPETPSAMVSHTVTIGTLRSAGGGLVSVPPGAPIQKVQSIMESNDFSQLALCEGDYTLKGAISWESIARATMYHGPPGVARNAIIPDPKVVKADEPLLDHVRTIADAGFVFVRDASGRLRGIVTSADLSEQFASLANPFLLIGEIERWLRVAVDSAFSPDELAGVADPNDPDRQIEAAQNLTFGEYVRLFKDPEAWAKLDWAADRQVFAQHLDEVRAIRNSIMHFSPDPIAAQDLERIERLLRWVRRLTETM